MEILKIMNENQLKKISVILAIIVGILLSLFLFSCKSTCCQYKLGETVHWMEQRDSIYIDKEGEVVSREHRDSTYTILVDDWYMKIDKNRLFKIIN